MNYAPQGVLSSTSSLKTALNHSEFLSRRFFQSLDGLRCISILAVIWHHTRGDWRSIPALDRGFLGVDMFFVLSGFLITTLLLRERQRTGNISLQKFYVRRSLRIFPIYYGLLALLTIAFWVIPHPLGQVFRHDLPFHLTYTSNWVHINTFLGITWSLATEQQFYLVWPPLEKFLQRTSTKVALLLGFIGINQLINFRLLDEPIHTGFGIYRDQLEILQSTFTPICLGVLVAYLLHSESGFRSIARWLAPRWTPAIVLLITFLACNIPVTDISGGVRLLVQVLMTVLLASCVIQENHWLRRILCFAPVRRIGVISYGMYLLHILVVMGVQSILDRISLHFSFDLFLVSLLITIGLSELSFRFYETRFLRLKHTFG